jgi:hypothetical protein
LDPILKQFHPFPIFIPYFSKMHFDILSSTPRSLKALPSLEMLRSIFSVACSDPVYVLSMRYVLNEEIPQWGSVCVQFCPRILVLALIPIWGRLSTAQCSSMAHILIVQILYNYKYERVIISDSMMLKQIT